MVKILVGVLKNKDLTPSFPLVLWHSFIDKHTAERWNGVGLKDHLTYYSGFEDDQRCKLRITGRVDFIKELPFPIRWALLIFNASILGH